MLTRQAEPPDAVLRYGDHADALIDLFLPPGLGRPQAPYPVVALVHGGFWRQEFDRRHLRPLANTLAARGRVVAVPEYRRVGGLGGWPQTAYDVRDALAAAPELIAAAAPAWTDPHTLLTVAGHSAGGHLALWAAHQSLPLCISHVVALAPVADLRRAAELSLDGGAAQQLLQGEPSDVPDRYAEAAVAARLDGSTRVTVIHGTADEQVPVDMSRALAERYAGRAWFSYRELDGVEHFALIDPRSPAVESVVWPVLETR